MPALVSDVIEIVCEFAESISDLAALRLVSRPWCAAVRSTLAFLNGRDDRTVDDKHGLVARYYVRPEAQHWLGDEPHGWVLARYCAIIFQTSLKSLTVRGRGPGEPGSELSSMNAVTEFPDHVAFPCLVYVHLGNGIPTSADVGLFLRADVSPKLQRLSMSHAVVSAGAGFLVSRAPCLVEVAGWQVGYDSREVCRILERHAPTLTSVSLQRVEAFAATWTALCACRALTKIELTTNDGRCASLARTIATQGALPPGLEELSVTFTRPTGPTLEQTADDFERKSDVTTLRRLVISAFESPALDALACILPFRDSLEELTLQHDTAGTAIFQAMPAQSGALITFPKLATVQVTSSMFVTDIPLQFATDVPDRFPALSRISTDREIVALAPLPRSLVRIELMESHPSLPKLLLRLSKTRRLRELSVPRGVPPLELAQCCPELEVFAGGLSAIAGTPPPLLLRAELGVATDAEWQRFVALLDAGAFRHLRFLDLCIHYRSDEIAGVILDSVLDGCPSLTQLDVTATRLGPPGRTRLPTGVLLGVDARQLTDRSATAMRHLQSVFRIDPAKFRR